LPCFSVSSPYIPANTPWAMVSSITTCSLLSPPSYGLPLSGWVGEAFSAWPMQSIGRAGPSRDASDPGERVLRPACRTPMIDCRGPLRRPRVSPLPSSRRFDIPHLPDVPVEVLETAAIHVAFVPDRLPWLATSGQGLCQYRLRLVSTVDG
jgi:hypothetical protein